jgi:hypothetical protein
VRKQQLTKGVAGSVFWDCPEGRPSSGTVTIVDKAGTALPVPISGATATVDSVNTTVSAWSASTPRQATLASITGVVVGRSYMITTAIGEKMLMRIKGLVVSTKVVYFFHDPPSDLAAGNVFVGVRISIAVVALNTATAAQNFRASWTYTVSSVVYYHDCLFDVWRVLPVNVATEAGLRRHAPDLTDRWHISALGEGTTWADRIDQAYESVLWDIEQRGPALKCPLANAMIDQQQLERAVYERVISDMSSAGFAPSGSSWTGDEWSKKRYAIYMATMRALESSITWVDDTGNAQSATSTEAASNFGHRLMR